MAAFLHRPTASWASDALRLFGQSSYRAICQHLCNGHSRRSLIGLLLRNPDRVGTTMISYCAKLAHEAHRADEVKLANQQIISAGDLSAPMHDIRAPRQRNCRGVGRRCRNPLAFKLNTNAGMSLSTTFTTGQSQITEYPRSIPIIYKCHRFGSKSCRHDWLSLPPHQVRQPGESLLGNNFPITSLCGYISLDSSIHVTLASAMETGIMLSSLP